MTTFKQHQQYLKVLLPVIVLAAGLLLTGCELIEIKPDIKETGKIPEKVQLPEQKQAVQDITRLTLDEIHQLPRFQACRALLSQAEASLKKKPVVPVKVEPLEGMPDEIKVDEMFYLEASAEQYPQDESIRHFRCPENINDVKVIYHLKKGPDYKNLYHFSYIGNVKGIDIVDPTNPTGKIESRYGDSPPEVLFIIKKLEIISLKPKQTFVNDDMSFSVDRFIFGGRNLISVRFVNLSEKKLAIRKFAIKLGTGTYEVDYKDDILYIEPMQLIQKDDVETGENMKKWYIEDSSRPINFTVSIVYKKGWNIKKLHIGRYVNIKDLGINMN